MPIRKIQQGFVLFPILVVGLIAVTLIGGVVYVTRQPRGKITLHEPTVSRDEDGNRIVTINYTFRWKSLKIANERGTRYPVITCNVGGASVKSNPLPSDTLEITDSLKVKLEDPKLSGKQQIRCTDWTGTSGADAKITVDLGKTTSASTSGEGETDLAAGPDWWIVYSVPTCFKRSDSESWSEMGAARIHFLNGKPGEITGVSLAGDINIRFRGTFDGQQLELMDKGFFKGGNPITLLLTLSSDGQQMTGTYKAKLGKDSYYEGCPSGGDIQGTATASVCKNVDGSGCP